jgi:hypothetical protein
MGLKNKKKYIIALIIECMILICFIMPFFKPLTTIDYDFRQMSDYSSFGQMTDEGYMICGEDTSGYKGIFTYYPFMTLQRGSYKIVINYKATTSDNTAKLSCNSYTSFETLKSDEVILSENKTSITFQTYLYEKIDNVQVLTNYGGNGDLTVKSVSVIQTRDMQRTDLTIVILLLVLVNFICYKKKNGKKYEREQLHAGILLGVTVLIASVPLFIYGLTDGNDLVFHLLRIEGIKEGLLSGQFPVRVHPMQLEGFGYACGVFYGDLLLYFPALLRIIGFSVQQSYKVFLLCINIATCMSTYGCLKSILKNRYIAVFGTALYMLAPYRIQGMYAGHTVGEACALIFVPLIVYGLYRIFTMDIKDKNYKNSFIYPTIGYCGLITCHILTTEMAGVFTILLCLICIRRTLRKETFLELCKTLVLSVLICMGFILPFMDYFFFDKFKVNAEQTTVWIQYWGLRLYQLLQVFPSAYDESISFDGGNGLDQMKNTGIAVLILAGAFIYAYHMADEKMRREAKKIWVVFSFGCLALFMSSIYFPWDFIRRILAHIKLEVIVNSIQFPTRFMQLAIFLLIISGMYGLWMLLQRNETVGVARNIVLVSAGFLLIQSVYHVNFIVSQQKEYSVYDLQKFTQRHTWSLEEYVPANTDLSYLTSIGVEPSDGIEITDYQKKYLDVRFYVQNSTDQTGYVDLPMLYYRGYRAEDENGNSVNTYNGYNNNVVRVDIAQGYAGSIHVYYQEPDYWRLAEIISLISLLCFVAYIFRCRNNR